MLVYVTALMNTTESVDKRVALSEDILEKEPSDGGFQMGIGCGTTFFVRWCACWGLV